MGVMGRGNEPGRAFPGIHCKISGMVTEADHESWDYVEFAPYVQHILEIFGPDRVMFGADWPVCLLAPGTTRS